jgi:hypothetical protein
MSPLINKGSSREKKELTPEQRRQRAHDLMAHLERLRPYINAPGFRDWNEAFQKAERSLHTSEDNSKS